MRKTCRLFSILLSLLFVLGSLLIPVADLSCPPEEASCISALCIIGSPGPEQMAFTPAPVCSDCHPGIIRIAVGATAMALPETASFTPSTCQEYSLMPSIPAAAPASSALKGERGPPHGNAFASCFPELKPSDPSVFYQLKGAVHYDEYL